MHNGVHSILPPDFLQELEAARRRVTVLEDANRAVECFLDRIARLSTFSQELGERSSVAEVCDLLFDEMRGVFPGGIMILALQDSDAQGFHVARVSPASVAEQAPEELEAQVSAGTFGWALTQRRVIMVPAIRLKDQLVLMPLTTARRTVGMLMVATRIPPTGVEQQQLILAAVAARHAAECLDNLSLVEELRDQNESIRRSAELALAQRVADLSLLVETAHTVSGTLKMDVVLRLLVQAVSQHLGVQMVGISLMDEGGRLPIVASSGCPPACLGGANGCGGGGGRLVTDVVQRRESLVIRDVSTEPRVAWCEHMREAGLTSFVGVPLIARDRVIGVLSVMTNAPREFTQDEVALLGGLAAQGALALENARLYEDLQRRIAEQQRALVRLVQSARMASVGLLASGVAHDINNPLCIISNHLQLFRLRPESLVPGVAASLGAIEACVQRIADAIQALLEYAGARPGERKPSDVNAATQRILLLLQNQSLFRRVRIVTDFASGLPPVDLDQVAWEQVLWELFTNAREAMPDGGAVTITTRTARGDGGQPVNQALRQSGHLEPQIAELPDCPIADCRLGEPGDPNRKSQIENQKSAGWVEVLVEDDGPGIQPAHLPQLFDPLFTTKESGKGMGMGLKIARDILAGHGGRLHVQSDGQRGTRVAIELPVSQPAEVDSLLDAHTENAAAPVTLTG